MSQRVQLILCTGVVNKFSAQYASVRFNELKILLREDGATHLQNGET